MAGPNLSVTRTIANTPAEHVNDHNLIHDAINDLYDPNLNPVNVKDYGATGDNATNDTTAIQAAIDAAGYGGLVRFPPGNYKYTSLTLNHSQHLMGAGWHSLRDAATTFGDAAYATAGNFGGTILRSTLTSGSSIVHVGSGGNNVMEGRVSDLMIIGPGSGTSVGIQVGSGSVSVVKPIYRNVSVANFATGVQMTNVDEASFELTIRGCTKALSLVTAVNANAFYGLNMQRCTDGVVFEDATSLANTFTSMICQNLTGTDATVQGEAHVFLTPYFENAGTRAMDFASASHCRVVSPSLQGTGGKDIRIQSGCFFNEFTGLKTSGGGAVSVTNAGNGTLLSGVLVNVTDTGTSTHLVDLNNALLSVPRLVVNNGGTGGPTLRSGSVAPEGAVTASRGALYMRTGGGAGTSLYIKESDTTNVGWVANAPAPDLTTGEMIPNRYEITSAAVTHASGTVVLCYFVADKTETITTLTAYTSGTAAGATPTLCRMGIYSIAANGDGTLVASTPNDTALFAAINTAYPKALSASLSKVAGQRYATALLVVSGAAMPTHLGAAFQATTPFSNIQALAPARNARITSQSDLPSSFVAATPAVYQQRTAMLLS